MLFRKRRPDRPRRRIRKLRLFAALVVLGVLGSAAFTLGRELLEHLGRPVEAAEAFATAGELALDSVLAQDALAREVECWSKAGRAEEAYQRALRFDQRYPNSHRTRMVQLFGGLASE